MLDYTTCCKLKAAGYPQIMAAPVAIVWRCNSLTGEHLAWSTSDGLTATDSTLNEVICPNSDELIAAIQQRFPGRLIEATHWPSGYTVINEVDPHTQQTADGPLIAGDNPAHAWANKYLALAGGDHG